MEPYQDFYFYLLGRTPLSMGMHAQDVLSPGYSWPKRLVEISYYSREVIDGLYPFPHSHPAISRPFGNELFELFPRDTPEHGMEVRLKNTPAVIPFPIEVGDDDGGALVDTGTFGLTAVAVDEFLRI